MHAREWFKGHSLEFEYASFGAIKILGKAFHTRTFPVNLHIVTTLRLETYFKPIKANLSFFKFFLSQNDPWNAHLKWP